ncbi:hypothetical protein PS662_01592 [Pseudomonas fluorescens]|uniref:Uncharacterized protein n=1 Tax=Pseudomonas fluorescens TaxID=294 RepID=A0A5E6RFD4_PSEFL|nr:hypothetical protein PS662_01592 [Pseudomonas fluorescens]
MLSSFNTWIKLALGLLVLFCGPTLYMISFGVESWVFTSTIS